MLGALAQPRKGEIVPNGEPATQEEFPLPIRINRSDTARL